MTRADRKVCPRIIFCRKLAIICLGLFVFAEEQELELVVFSQGLCLLEPLVVVLLVASCS